MKNSLEGEKSQRDDFKGLILTDEQYRDHPFAHAEGERNYVFEVSSGGKTAVYFGSSHTNDPSDPLFELIEKKFKEVNPDIVYVEGMEQVNNQSEGARKHFGEISDVEAKEEGENHFALKLAVDEGIDFESPEPSLLEEIKYLLKQGFSREDIFTFYIFRDVAQYIRTTDKKSIEDCKKYLTFYLKELKEASNWDAKELDTWEEGILLGLDFKNGEYYSSQVDPIPWEGKPQSVINEISRGSSEFRDRHIFERIAEGLKKYNKLFVVYGSAHAVKQEPALRALISRQSN